MDKKAMTPIGGVVFISAIATLITSSIDLAFVGYSRGVVHNTTLSALNLVDEMDLVSLNSAAEIDPVLLDYIEGSLTLNRQAVFPAPEQIKLTVVKYQEQPEGLVALWYQPIYGSWSYTKDVVGAVGVDDGTSPIKMAVIAVYEDQAMTYRFCDAEGCELKLDR